MRVNVDLCTTETNDLAIMIDLLRASTTITLALNNFDEVIPVNSTDKAFMLREQYGAILAGEENAQKIENFDVSNSPFAIQDYSGKILVIKTTNGTEVLSNILRNNENTKILIGCVLNAHAVAEKALKLAKNEISLVMAGWRNKFTMEDFIGAGLIINEMISICDEKNINLELSEFAQMSLIMSDDTDISQTLIYSSDSAERLKSINAYEDINTCLLINESDNVPIYSNGKIKLL